MTSLKTSIKTITYLSDIGCLEIQGASLPTVWRTLDGTGGRKLFQKRLLRVKCRLTDSCHNGRLPA
ncbi:hypothetical protein EAO28_11540 [Klebsiella pneumoniae]|uniref:Nitrite extrusion protein 2 n=1 Tax=Klebsiella pneumoniae TaxID=573 RepID=A0A3P2EJW9_KLEPN|nr:hypothetical protein EAO28_11540 [Klebsiella pneumoniae]